MKVYETYKGYVIYSTSGDLIAQPEARRFSFAVRGISEESISKIKKKIDEYIIIREDNV